MCDDDTEGAHETSGLSKGEGKVERARVSVSREGESVYVVIIYNDGTDGAHEASGLSNGGG